MGNGNSEPLGLRRAQSPLSHFLGERFNPEVITGAEGTGTAVSSSATCI